MLTRQETVTSHIHTVTYLSLMVRKWIKSQTLVVHRVSFSLDTSDFHTITISCRIFDPGKYFIA